MRGKPSSRLLRVRASRLWTPCSIWSWRTTRRRKRSIFWPASQTWNTASSSLGPASDLTRRRPIWMGLFTSRTIIHARGDMPRFLGYYVRGKGLLRLGDAIRKITSLPANREHLAGRGLLKPGFYADITIFNAAEIKDTATYLRPASLSEGIEYVFVNGQLEFEHGHLTGIKAGKPLRGPGWRKAEGGKQ